MQAKRTVRYFLAILGVLLVAFFSNDFNLVAVQKTAIITAIGIDKEDDAFTLTAVIANPAAQGDNGQTAGGKSGGNGYNVVEGKGGTVAKALEDINAKTGWYPKLVFCRLILLGETLCNSNVFDGLDYFLRNEYTAKDALLATTGKAKDILSAKPPFNAAVSDALEKVLSDQPKRVGTVLTATLREFSIGYFSAGSSGYMPIVQTEKAENGDLFQASETALFQNGKQIGRLSREETFALACVQNPLRLASYTIRHQGADSTLLIKNNRRKLHFSLDGDQPKMDVELTVYADLDDRSVSSSLSDLSMRENKTAVFTTAAERLQDEIEKMFLSCQAVGFDAFDAIGKLQKYENAHYPTLKDSLVERLQISVSVSFRSVR